MSDRFDIDSIDVSKLTDAQLDGRACVRCGAQDGQPTIPLYGVLAGAMLFVHAAPCGADAE